VITYPVHGDDEAAIAQLLPDVAEVHVHHPPFPEKVIAPHLLEELFRLN
jgi:hypothetical protein